MKVKTNKIIGLFLIVVTVCISGLYYYHYNKIAEIDRKTTIPHPKSYDQSLSTYVYVKPNLQFNEARQKSLDICESLNVLMEIICFLSVAGFIIMKVNKKRTVGSVSE